MLPVRALRTVHRVVQKRFVSQRPSPEPLPMGAMVKSDGGQTYRIDEILSDRREIRVFVYRAKANGNDFVVKNMYEDEFDYQLKLQKSVSNYPNVRPVIDTVRESGLFIYPYLGEDLLEFSKKDLSQDMRKSILRRALQGLVDLHDKDVYHTDIKPNNIFLDYEEKSNSEITVSKVQIGDLEESIILPPNKWVIGPLCGNPIWRSPESWCESSQNQAADVFSFAIVMIYVVYQHMLFRVSSKLLRADDAWRHVLPLHLSFIADENSLCEFFDHIGENNPYYQRIMELISTFGSENPRRPFSLREAVELEFRDLVGKMTYMDPQKRITAKEALQHSWFQENEPTL